MENRPSPEQTRPELTGRGQAWRLAVCIAFGLLVWSSAIEAEWTDHRAIFVGEVVLGLVALVLVLYRRRAPVAIATVLAVLSSGSALAAGAATLAAVSVATLRRPVSVVWVGLVNFVSANVYTFYAPFELRGPWWLSVGVNLVVNAAMMGWGMYIGSRRELVWTLQQRAERAEAEQTLRVSQGQSLERERIAREMHDVLAHRITHVSMQAGALAFREDLSAQELRSGLTDIQGKANDALHELRGVLGVLRDDDGNTADAPQPTYDDIAALVSESRANGLNIVFDDFVSRDQTPVPDAVGRALYRIVQEGLTNASKHAPGALVTVRLSGTPEEGITAVIRNPIGFAHTQAPGAGMGLVGLTERAELRGGTLVHGRRGALFVVRAWIPWAP